MFRGEYEPKGGGAACVAGSAGAGRCLYENASGQADLWMAERDDRTILRGGQGEPRPALCAHAWDTEHAGAMFPDSGGAKHQEAGGLFAPRSYISYPCVHTQTQGFVSGLKRLCKSPPGRLEYPNSFFLEKKFENNSIVEPSFT